MVEHQLPKLRVVGSSPIVRLMKELDPRLLDLLTGLAAERYKYVDVREPDEYARKPPRYPVTHVPLGELRSRLPSLFDRDAPIVLYGTTDDETEVAEVALQELGYVRVNAFRGGFETLARVGLV